MMLLLEILLWLAVMLVGLPTVVLMVQCAVATVGPVRRAPDPMPDQPRPRTAVLVPAHDEQEIIADTIRRLRTQLEAGDRLVVVADNCTDATAARARAAGAEVIEREDPQRRGKGYALARGVSLLRADPPQVLVVIDADCRAEPGTIDHLARLVGRLNLPQQGLDLLDAPPGLATRAAISQLAFVVKNHVRPTGLQRLGVPCPLMGTGMAIPFAALDQVDLATGHLSEDMKLGIDLAIAGYPARFCPQAKVFSPMAGDTASSLTQRTRWEQGHLHTLLTQTPRLLYHALRQRRPRLLAMAADLLVPPLAALSLLVLAVIFWTGLGAALGASPWPLYLSSALALGLALTVLAAWARFGRDRVPAQALLAIPVYILWKLPIYVGFLWQRQRDWVRTQRQAPRPPP